MITPRFQLKQTENSLEIIIRAPYCSLKELDVSAEDTSFVFTCKPYYLRLVLPGAIIENDAFHSSFNADTNEFSFTYEKLIPGEDFKDLDYITKFLCEKVEVNDGARKIEILTSTGGDNQLVINEGCEYGFALRGGYNFTEISSEFEEIFDIDPFKVSFDKREELRLVKESNDFDYEHYLADLIDGETIHEIIKLPAEIPTDDFNSIELDFLKDLHNIQYSLSEQQKRYCRNSLLDILYAYCYDRRTTFYEGTCESGWTINKLAASLSSFGAFDTPKAAIVSSIKRSMIYPLYRHWDLSMKIFDDLKAILHAKQTILIKILIKIDEIFLGGDSSRYVLNNLFIKDYIVYVQKWDHDEWAKIVEDVDKLVLTKKDLGLKIFEQDLSDMMGNLVIKEDSDDSDDDSDDSSDSSSYSLDTDTGSSTETEDDCKKS